LTTCDEQQGIGKSYQDAEQTKQFSERQPEERLIKKLIT
jgi:hypothetical protein